MERAAPVDIDFLKLREMGLSVVEGDLLARSVRVRHHPDHTAAIAMQLALEGRGHRDLKPVALAGPL